jgi:hypothetical protein
MEMIVYEVHYGGWIWGAVLPADEDPPVIQGFSFHALGPWQADSAFRALCEVNRLGQEDRSALLEWNDGAEYRRDRDPRFDEAAGPVQRQSAPSSG